MEAQGWWWATSSYKQGYREEQEQAMVSDELPTQTQANVVTTLRPVSSSVMGIMIVLVICAAEQISLHKLRITILIIR